MGAEAQPDAAVKFNKTIPTDLYTWMETNSYSFEGFLHAMLCQRPAWLYQRLSDDAPLNNLVKEVFPDDNTFWFTWAFIPQLININILWKHFTAHTWLNWVCMIIQFQNILLMISAPKKHLEGIPVRCIALFLLWGLRFVGHEMFKETFITFFFQYMSVLFVLEFFYMNIYTLLSFGLLPEFTMSWWCGSRDANRKAFFIMAYLAAAAEQEERLKNE